MTTNRSPGEPNLGRNHFPETRILRNSAEEDRRFVDASTDFPTKWLHKMMTSIAPNDIALVGHIRNARMSDYLWALARHHAPNIPL